MAGNLLFTENFLIRLVINTLAMLVLVRLVYFPTYHKRDFFFTFFLFNFIVFLLAFILLATMDTVKAFGSGIGLLAAFSLLRFRTEPMTIKDMTYLFIIMTLGIINSIIHAPYLEIFAINSMIIVAVYIVDGDRLMRNQKFKTIEYDRLDKIKPELHAELILELRERTGLDIRKISIETIDFAKSRTVIKVYYY